ncbi:MAG: chemotaxis protein CheX [bacterium]|nr:chemotaxis protein CheX [bacterium]
MTTATGTSPLEAAADAVRETCEMQLGLTLRALPPCDRGVAEAEGWCHSGIDLVTRDGRWRLTLVADALSACRLAQRLYALDSDEDPAREELADALNELVNITAGVFKRDHRGTALHLALPVFATGWPDREPMSHDRETVRLAAGAKDPQFHVLLGWLQTDEPRDGRNES